MAAGIALFSAPTTCQEAAGPWVTRQTHARERLPKGHRHTPVLERSKNKHPGLTELVCNTQLLYHLPL